MVQPLRLRIDALSCQPLYYFSKPLDPLDQISWEALDLLYLQVTCSSVRDWRSSESLRRTGRA